MDYDEREVIEQTVYRYYRHLLTPREYQVALAFHAKAKAQAYQDPEREDRTRAIMGTLGDSEIDAIVTDGFLEFRRAVVDRILRDHGSGISFNRCPACQRIVRTPLAKQCMWCKHDWH